MLNSATRVRNSKIAIPVYKDGKLSRVRHVRCFDGKRRSARIKGRQDWDFQISATIEIDGKTISGYILRDGRDYIFKQKISSDY